MFVSKKKVHKAFKEKITNLDNFYFYILRDEELDKEDKLACQRNIEQRVATLQEVYKAIFGKEFRP